MFLVVAPLTSCCVGRDGGGGGVSTPFSAVPTTLRENDLGIVCDDSCSGVIIP